MKPTLPICIPSLPSPDTSPALWQQIAPILSAIAERERNDENLYPYEKIAYSALSFANWNASKKQWGVLWQYLLDRQIVQISEIATPPPKPKSDRPTKPPKNVKDSKSKSNPKQKKTTKGIKLESVRIVTKEQLQQALTDTWLDISTIAKRFRDMGVNLTLPQTEDLLNNRASTHEIFKAPKGLHDAALYSRIQATEIECDLLSLNMAFKLAQSRDYPFTKKALGEASTKVLTQYGISFKPRKEMGDLDNKLLNYSDIWRDIQS